MEEEGLPPGERDRPSRRRTGCCLSGCLTLLALVGIPLYLIITPPPPPPPLTPSQVKAASEGLDELRQEIGRTVKAAESGQEYSFHLTITQDEINVALQTDNKLKGLFDRHEVKRPYVELVDNLAVASASVTLNGVAVVLTARVQPVLDPTGHIELKVTGIDVGRLGMSNRTAKAYGEKLVSKLNEKVLSWNAKIREIKIEAGRIEVYGDSR